MFTGGCRNRFPISWGPPLLEAILYNDAAAMKKSHHTWQGGRENWRSFSARLSMCSKKTGGEELKSARGPLLCLCSQNLSQFFNITGSKHVLTALQRQNLPRFFNITGSKHVLTALQGQNLSPFFNITSSKHVLTALQGQNLSPFFKITSSKHVLPALERR